MPAGSSVSGSNDAQLTLTTLGGWGLSALLGTDPASLFGPSKPLALLAYLALSPGRTAQREHLLDLLWADLEPTAARHAYRQTIWYIRQRLGEASLKAGGNQLSLVAAVLTDCDSFLAAVERQDWERAVAVYAGDFLPGFAAPGGAEFERWVDLERFRLRGLFARAGEALARRHLTAGHAREAVALARRVRDTDRASEPGWRLLLEALMAAGDAVGAAVEADGLERMLQEEGRDPEPATRAALRVARQQPQYQLVDGATPTTLVAELIGREREFGAIVAAWDAARHGASRHIHIAGAAGLGKSRLLADAQTRLRASGARTLLVRATPGERTLSYALAADLAVALATLPGSAGISAATAGTLVGLAPALASRYPAAEPDRSAGDELPRRRVLAVAELLAAVADEAPLALLLDDAHWMDGHSRRLVATLVGRLGRSPVLVVSTARPGPEGQLESGITELLSLEPLTASQVGALVASFGPIPHASWASTLPERLRAAADGSPLIVLETLELAIERAILDLGPAGWQCPAPDDLERLLAGGAALRQRLERLSREQRWLLLLLAVHGTPLSLDMLLLAAPRSRDSFESDISTLEQRGLVLRQQGNWQPMHDAIAEMAIELAPEEAIHAAHAALGSAVAVNSADSDALARAAQHFAAAGDVHALDLVFRRWLRAVRSQGDRRGLKPLARELLGHEGNGRVDALVRALPVHVRLGVVTPARIAVLVGLVGLAAAGVGSRLASRSGVAIRIVSLMPDGDSSRPVQIEVRDADLLAQRTLDLATGARVSDLPGKLPSGAVQFTSLGGGVWSWALETGRPNGQEPFVGTRRGWLHVPPAPGDDAVESISPDGGYLALYTDRWSASNAGDVAVFDIARHSVRQLTSGPTRDIAGAWSRDGTRIAFIRRHYDLQPDELCWVTFDGRRKSCFAPPGWNVVSFAGGWFSPHEILVLGLDSAGTSSVYSVNLDTHTSNQLFAATAARGLGNTTWILGLCPAQAGGGNEWQLRRSDVPGRAIHLTGVSGLVAPPALAFADHEHASQSYLSSIGLIGPPAGAVAPGVPFRYRISGLAADGHPIEVPVVEWATADSSIATISADGVLIGNRPGRTTVYASAGGWRSDSAAVNVAAKSEHIDLSETWTGPWAARWRVYGEPVPRVVRGPGGMALFVAGDSSYYSGVYSRTAFASDSGLGVRLTIRTPSPVGKWQEIHVSLSSLLDSAALRTWDHRTAALPRTAEDVRLSCEAGYPAGEAAWSKNYVLLSAGGEAVYAPVSPTLANGSPWVLTLQLLPDGRCGVAVNGNAMQVSMAEVSASVSRHLIVDGQSVRTRLLVENIEVWRGVKNDIDWTRPEGH